MIVLSTPHWRRFNNVQNLIAFCATRWHIWGIQILGGGEEEVYVVAASHVLTLPAVDCFIPCQFKTTSVNVLTLHRASSLPTTKQLYAPVRH